MSSAPEKPSSRPWPRIRQLLALAFLLFGVYAAVWLYRECTRADALKDDGSVVTLTTCASPSLSSATVLLFVLLVVALLWPDISEITVLGVSLKRKVEQAQAAAETARESVDNLRQMVQFQQTQIDSVTSATATSTTHIHLGDSANVKDVQERLREQASEVLSESQSLQEPVVTRPSTELSDNDLKIEVLSGFETLATILGLNSVPRRERIIAANHRRRSVQQFFLEDHAGPIRSVKAVRNAVAHAQHVSREDLENALVVLHGLIAAAEQHFFEHDIPVPW